MGGERGDGDGSRGGRETNELACEHVVQTPPAPPTPLARFVRCRPRAAGSMNEGGRW